MENELKNPSSNVRLEKFFSSEFLAEWKMVNFQKVTHLKLIFVTRKWQVCKVYVRFLILIYFETFYFLQPL